MTDVGLSDLGVGDIDVPYLDVSPAAGDTAGTATLHRPDGTSAPLAVTAGVVSTDPVTGVASRRLTSEPITFTQAGKWVLSWTATGTGAGAEDAVFWVTPRPAAGGPTWTPGLSRVAAYIPRLTVDQTTPGSATERGTFDDHTNPTGQVAQRHIDDAVAEVAALAGTVPDALHALASAIAARRAAASILRAYGDDRSGQNALAFAAALDARADTDLTRLQTEIAEDEEPYGIDVAPAYSFPPAVPWGDYI
ncbi:hypothetical protein AB0F72_09055 [Actinoplanes sp. NPDC023936]|uniref:hypothetical protein n=1 Tax=Actinoplanes sp. NPDC023936 TaxID=3154910 RepID=UPI0034054F74